VTYCVAECCPEHFTDFSLGPVCEEGWSVSTLRQKIDSMLFERTAVSRKPEKLVRKELDALRADNQWGPDMVFRDPYILDFLKLSNTYSERDLETAILRDMEAFLLEMGSGFSFVTKTKAAA